MFYLYPKHFHLSQWYIHRIPAVIKRELPAFPDKLLVPLEYIFNHPHKIKGLDFKVNPESVDAVLITDPTWCIFDLSPFKNALKIYYSIDNIYETSFFHDQLLIKIEKFDYVFTAHRKSIPDFSKMGPKTYWAPLSFDPDINKKLNRPKDLDVSFVGNIYGARINDIDYLKIQLANLHTFFGNAYQHDMNEIYNRSKIVLNFANKKELNYRVFEVLGSGGFLLNEYSKETFELFENNVDLVSFFDLDELIEKVYYYLERNSECEKISSSGHRKAEESHTIEARMKELLTKVNLL